MLLWDAPLDWGGRSEMTYRVLCERREQDGGQWEACDDRVLVLPDSNSLTSTSVNLTVSPYHHYRLSVQARNDISNLQGVQHSSTAPVTLHRLSAPPVVTIVNITQNPVAAVPVTMPRPQKGPFLWTTVGVLFAVLFLLAVVPSAVCILQRKYSSMPRLPQEVELLPIHSGISYTRVQQPEVISQPVNTVLQVGGDDVLDLVQVLGTRLADSLMEVLVQRHQLTLGKELGKGEFGSVYEAVFVQDEVSTKVAVKTMRVGFHSQEDLHEFLREAEIMKNFDHDNVVRLLGVTLQRDEDSPVPVPLVILPYMKHRDLRRFLIATRYGDIPMFVPHQTLLRFMVDIAEGMDYLSSQGFLHRDLAARNCMLGDDLRVCVADFGLSRQMHDSNYYRQKEAIRVPIKWMALESLSESVYTTKSDVWSFGVTMWEIVSRGRTPYPGVHNHDLLDLLLMGHRLKAPDDCDTKLWEVMYSCWRGSPLRGQASENLLTNLKLFCQNCQLSRLVRRPPT
uniref:receptor protein-tyrosine kinase n=1 Tax=Neogobius melanostomus TaxID=47308 RepID=A0A8C6TWG8_9GOBI